MVLEVLEAMQEAGVEDRSSPPRIRSTATPASTSSSPRRLAGRRGTPQSRRTSMALVTPKIKDVAKPDLMTA
jgi:hypothetical protein